MNPEDARFAGDIGEEYREPAWERILDGRRPYLLQRASWEQFSPPQEFACRIKNHGWWARDDFRHHRRENSIASDEWLLNRLIPSVLATRSDFDADGQFAERHLEDFRRIAARRLPRGDLDEFVNTLWMTVTRYLPSYDPARNEFVFWVNRIAANTAKASAIKEGANGMRNFPRMQDTVRFMPAAASEGLEDSTEGVIEGIERSENQDSLRNWSNKLLSRIRGWDEMASELVHLRIVEGLEFQEIARRWETDERLMNTFKVFFNRTPWEPTADKVRRLFNTILRKIRESEGGES